ncbi:hypothetical protein [Salinibacterium sp. PAMC 21357]|uniref:hypothetical protein n=1 Tax=Salinibacterium sp. PAMC 21357 TaxID=1112215 RepID=UPI000287A76E|nr:hypothetical protein [Salinibacterium sp. PAMC 21357]
MNFADTLRGLARRWYITVPGFVLAIILAIFTFTTVEPGYERTATQLLLPGEGTIPTGATNPFLFLGGLTQSADVLVRSLNSEEVVGMVVEEYPGTEIAVSKDPSTSGPIILITVTATSDANAAAALTDILSRSSGVLSRLQTEQRVKTVDRIQISTLTHDQSSSLQQRNRLAATAGVGAGIVMLTVLAASLMEGLSRRGRHRATNDWQDDEEDEEDEDEGEDEIANDDADRSRQTAFQPPRLSGRGRVAGRDRAGVRLPIKGGVSTSSDLPAWPVKYPVE